MLDRIGGKHNPADGPRLLCESAEVLRFIRAIVDVSCTALASAAAAEVLPVAAAPGHAAGSPPTPLQIRPPHLAAAGSLISPWAALISHRVSRRRRARDGTYPPIPPPPLAVVRRIAQLSTLGLDIPFELRLGIGNLLRDICLAHTPVAVRGDAVAAIVALSCDPALGVVSSCTPGAAPTAPGFPDPMSPTSPQAGAHAALSALAAPLAAAPAGSVATEEELGDAFCCSTVGALTYILTGPARAMVPVRNIVETATHVFLSPDDDTVASLLHSRLAGRFVVRMSFSWGPLLSVTVQLVKPLLNLLTVPGPPGRRAAVLDIVTRIVQFAAGHCTLPHVAALRGPLARLGLGTLHPPSAAPLSVWHSGANDGGVRVGGTSSDTLPSSGGGGPGPIGYAGAQMATTSTGGVPAFSMGSFAGPHGGGLPPDSDDVGGRGTPPTFPYSAMSHSVVGQAPAADWRAYPAVVLSHQPAAPGTPAGDGPASHSRRPGSPTPPHGASGSPSSLPNSNGSPPVPPPDAQVMAVTCAQLDPSVWFPPPLVGPPAAATEAARRAAAANGQLLGAYDFNGAAVADGTLWGTDCAAAGAPAETLLCVGMSLRDPFLAALLLKLDQAGCADALIALIQREFGTTCDGDGDQEESVAAAIAQQSDAELRLLISHAAAQALHMIVVLWVVVFPRSLALGMSGAFDKSLARILRVSLGLEATDGDDGALGSVGGDADVVAAANRGRLTKDFGDASASLQVQPARMARLSALVSSLCASALTAAAFRVRGGAPPGGVSVGGPIGGTPVGALGGPSTMTPHAPGEHNTIPPAGTIASPLRLGLTRVLPLAAVDAIALAGADDAREIQSLIDEACACVERGDVSAVRADRITNVLTSRLARNDRVLTVLRQRGFYKRLFAYFKPVPINGPRSTAALFWPRPRSDPAVPGYVEVLLTLLRLCLAVPAGPRMIHDDGLLHALADAILTEAEGPGHDATAGLTRPLSRSSLRDTASGVYFSVISVLWHSRAGRLLLLSSGVLDALAATARGVQANGRSDILRAVLVGIDFAAATAHGAGGLSRPHEAILEAALVLPPPGVRVLATETLRPLATAAPAGRLEWCVGLLVGQLSDSDPSVSTLAVRILGDIVVTERDALRMLIAAKPPIAALSHALRLRALALPSGVALLEEGGWVDRLLTEWDATISAQYAVHVQRLVYGTADRPAASAPGQAAARATGVGGSGPHGLGRSTSPPPSPPQSGSASKMSATPPLSALPMHLHGQLARTDAGLQRLVDSGVIDKALSELLVHVRTVCLYLASRAQRPHAPAVPTLSSHDGSGDFGLRNRAGASHDAIAGQSGPLGRPSTTLARPLAGIGGSTHSNYERQPPHRSAFSAPRALGPKSRAVLSAAVPHPPRRGASSWSTHYDSSLRYASLSSLLQTKGSLPSGTDSAAFHSNVAAHPSIASPRPTPTAPSAGHSPTSPPPAGTASDLSGNAPHADSAHAAALIAACASPISLQTAIWTLATVGSTPRGLDLLTETLLPPDQVPWWMSVIPAALGLTGGRQPSSRGTGYDTDDSMGPKDGSSGALADDVRNASSHTGLRLSRLQLPPGGAARPPPRGGVAITPLLLLAFAATATPQLSLRGLLVSAMCVIAQVLPQVAESAPARNAAARGVSIPRAADASQSTANGALSIFETVGWTASVHREDSTHSQGHRQADGYWYSVAIAHPIDVSLWDCEALLPYESSAAADLVASLPHDLSVPPAAADEFLKPKTDGDAATHPPVKDSDRLEALVNVLRFSNTLSMKQAWKALEELQRSKEYILQDPWLVLCVHHILRTFRSVPGYPA